jgi:hypothetical protein
MEDKELWVIFFHGFMAGRNDRDDIATLALKADSAMREYKQRWNNKQLASTEEVGKWIQV